MSSKAIVGVVIAVVAVGGITALVFSQKDGFGSHHDEHEQSAEQKDQSVAPGDTTSPGNSNQSNTAQGEAVAIESFAYSPATLTVKKGTTVTWTNKDSAPHTVTVDSGSGPASGNMSKGDTYSFTFNDVGTFNYHCKIHPSMTAKVVVTE